MKIGIVGAGGVGAYIGGRLALAGEEVCFLARGQQLEAFRTNGLTIEGPGSSAHLHPMRASSEPGELGVVDAVILSVKLWDVEKVAAAIGQMVGDDTVIVTLQNGVDAGDMVSGTLPMAIVARGAMYISCHIERPGVVACVSDRPRMVVEGLNGNARLLALADACAHASLIGCDLVDDGGEFLWRKFVALSAFAAASALTGRTLAQIRDNKESRLLLQDLINEAAAVALAKLPVLPPDLAGSVSDLVMNSWTGEAIASMAVDLAHGRPLELRWLSGKVHALGLEYGIPTPAHTTTFRSLVLREHGERLAK